MGRPTTLDLRRGYATSCPPRQVNDSNKGSNGPAGSRSGKLHYDEGRPFPNKTLSLSLSQALSLALEGLEGVLSGT